MNTITNHLEFGYLKFDPFGSAWLVSIVSLITVGLCVWSLFWIFNDAKKRGKNSWGVVLFAIVAGYPISLLWWLWLRPPQINQPPPHIAVPPTPPR